MRIHKHEVQSSEVKQKQVEWSGVENNVAHMIRQSLVYLKFQLCVYVCISTVYWVSA